MPPVITAAIRDMQAVVTAIVPDSTEVMEEDSTEAVPLGVMEALVGMGVRAVGVERSPGIRRELKIWPEHFAAVTNPDILRRKTVEVRKDDRGYRVGDVLILREWDPGSDSYTGRQVEVLVTHILRGWGLREDWAALSILWKGDGCCD